MGVFHCFRALIEYGWNVVRSARSSVTLASTPCPDCPATKASREAVLPRFGGSLDFGCIFAALTGHCRDRRLR